MKTFSFCFLIGKNFNRFNVQKKELRVLRKNYFLCSNKNFPSKREEINRRKMIDKMTFHFLFGILFFPSKNAFSEKSETVQSKSFLTKTGLKVLDFEKGNGEVPKWGDLLLINYVLYLSDSKGLEKIDSTYDRKAPFLFQHGGGQIVIGLEEAVHDMKVGGKRRIVLPDNLGYSNPGLGPIPPAPSGRKKLFKKIEENSTEKSVSIIFDIEILKIKEPENKFEWYNTNQLSITKLQQMFNEKEI